jgi:hypothetical protein
MRDSLFIILVVICSFSSLTNSLGLRQCRKNPTAPGPSTTITLESTKPSDLKEGQCFSLKNLANGKYLSENRGGLEVGYDAAKSDSTKICIEALGNNEYILHWKSRNDPSVFDIYGGGDDDGVRLIKYPRHGGPNQRFKFIQNENIYAFQAVNSGKAFGARGDQNVQRKFDGKSDQLYLMEF